MDPSMNKHTDRHTRVKTLPSPFRWHIPNESGAALASNILKRE